VTKETVTPIDIEDADAQRSVSEAPKPQVEAAVALSMRADDTSARIISIFSPKGGSGKTVIAVNTAVALAQKGKKVLLVDFDMKSPMDIAKSLNISPSHSLVRVVAEKNLDPNDIPAAVRGCIVRYSDTLHYVTAINTIRQFMHIKPEHVKAFLPPIKNDYDYLVVDAGSELTDVLINLFDISNLIGLVVTPDVLSLYKTEWCLEILQGLRFPLAMLKLILNRAESRGSFSVQEMKLLLPCEIVGVVPSDGKALNYAINRQVPCVLDDPNSKFSQGIEKIVETLLVRRELFLYLEEDARAKQNEAMEQANATFWKEQGLAAPLEAAKNALTEDDEYVQLKKRVHMTLLTEMNLTNVSTQILTKKGEEYEKLRKQIEDIVSDILATEQNKFTSSVELRQKFIRDVVDETLGYGPLEDLIKDESVSEIMVNNKNKIYVEKSGKIYLTAKKFISDQQIRMVIERILAPLGRRIDESIPMVDARLPDGSRVNAIIPPLALSGSTLTIRKFSQKKLSQNDLIERFGSLTKEMAMFLESSVKLRKNIIVSGGTDSGKTTFLNVLSECIPDDERVITIEDAAELKLHHQHWIRLESKPPNIEGKGEISIRDLFKNTLRMRPDRIIVGECRGPEVIDMLQAMNTGHDGSMSTVHANNPRDVMTRLDALMLMSGVDIPLRAIREMISSAVDVVVQTAKLSDGGRRVTYVTEVLGLDEEGSIKLNDIFKFEQRATSDSGEISGAFVATGNLPTYFDDFFKRGHKHITKDLFEKRDLADGKRLPKT
jgi:Flp pilus assembly CpaF family ATPase/MinD-like ATPase involved in chromosome partitioning or flagellar assembly